MSSIKVKIAQTDGSYFISSPNNDLPTNFDFSPQSTNFGWGGSNYVIENYKVDPSQDIINWNAGIELAYRYICLYPNETGYPNLGTELSLNAEYIPYLALDGQKSMNGVVSSLGLSDTAVVDFSLIYSWSEFGASFNTDDFKAIVGQLNVVGQQVADDADTLANDCVAIVAGGPFTWPAVIDSSGNVVLEEKECSTQLCCQEYKPVYQLAKLQTESAPIFADANVSADTIVKKHIYKFVQSGGN